MSCPNHDRNNLELKTCDASSTSKTMISTAFMHNVATIYQDIFLPRKTDDTSNTSNTPNNGGIVLNISYEIFRMNDRALPLQKLLMGFKPRVCLALLRCLTSSQHCHLNCHSWAKRSRNNVLLLTQCTKSIQNNQNSCTGRVSSRAVNFATCLQLIIS